MAVGDVWRFVIRTTRTGSANVCNQFHYVIDVEPSAATETQIGSAFNTSVVVPFRAFCMSSVVIAQFTTQRVWPLPATLETVHLIGLNGTRVGTAASQNVSSICGIISRKTGFIGPQNRGRIYLGNTNEADFNNLNQATAAYTTALNTLAPNLQTALASGAPNLPAGTIMVPCLWHRPNGPLRRITSHVVRAYSGVQRKRLGDRWP